MKPIRTHLRALLSLLLTLATVPGAAACLRSCSADAASLECLRLCSRSHALMTQGGELPSIAASDCGVDLDSAAVLASVSSFELGAPSLLAVPAPAVSTPALLERARLLQAGRAPPSAHDFLSSRHPQANAPPSFC